MAETTGYEPGSVDLNAPDSIQYYGLHLAWSDGVLQVTSAWDHDEFQMTTGLFTPGHRVLVAGGGLGSVAAWTALQVGVENVVVSEPNLTLAGLCADHVRVGGKPLAVLPIALGTRSGETDFYLRDGGHSSFSPPGEKVRIPMIDINAAITISRINALSLDVEGAEWDLIPHINWAPITALLLEIHGPLERARSLIAEITTLGGLQEKRWHTQHPEYDLHVVGMIREE